MIIRAFALAIFVLAFGVQAQAQAPAQAQTPAQIDLKMDLEKCVLRAIEANPQMKSAKQQIFGATEGVRAAVSAFAPVGTASYYSQAANTSTPVTETTGSSGSSSSGASGTQAATKQAVVNGTSYVASLDLNVHQPLFTGFRLLSAYQKAKLAKDQADSMYQNAELTLVRSVQTAFLSLLSYRANVKSNEDSVARLESQYKVTKAFYDVGLRAQLDVFQAEADLATAKEALLSAQNSVDIQLAQLNSYLNIPLDQDVEYVGELSQIPFKMTLREALDAAYKQRPDVSIALKSVEMAEKDATTALSQGLPQVSADYDYIREGDKYWLRDKNVSFTERNQFQLSVTWRAWDWGNTAFNYRQANDNVKKLQADLATLRLNVGVDVKTQYLNIQDAAKRIAVAKAGRVAAYEGYRQAVARYQAQVGTNTDVLTAQAQATNADFQLTQALTDYQTAISNIYFSIGRKNPNLSM
jgi:outer membrane protein TolC